MNEKTCFYCGEPADLTFYEVTGWIERRQGGGPHGVIAPKPTGRYTCTAHMALLRRGINLEQGSLLDAPQRTV